MEWLVHFFLPPTPNVFWPTIVLLGKKIDSYTTVLLDSIPTFYTNIRDLYYFIG